MSLGLKIKGLENQSLWQRLNSFSNVLNCRCGLNYHGACYNVTGESVLGTTAYNGKQIIITIRLKYAVSVLIDIQLGFSTLYSLE